MMEENGATLPMSHTEINNRTIDSGCTTGTGREMEKENGAISLGIVDLINEEMAELKAKITDGDVTDRDVKVNGGHDNGMSDDNSEIEDANKSDRHRTVLEAKESESVLSLEEEMKGSKIEVVSMSDQESHIEGGDNYNNERHFKELAAELQQTEDDDDEDEESDESIMSMESMEYIPPPPIVDAETLSPQEANTMDVPVVVTGAHAVARKTVDRSFQYESVIALKPLSKPPHLHLTTQLLASSSRPAPVTRERSTTGKLSSIEERITNIENMLQIAIGAREQVLGGIQGVVDKQTLIIKEVNDAAEQQSKDTEAGIQKIVKELKDRDTAGVLTGVEFVEDIVKTAIGVREQMFWDLQGGMDEQTATIKELKSMLGEMRDREIGGMLERALGIENMLHTAIGMLNKRFGKVQGAMDEKLVLIKEVRDAAEQQARDYQFTMNKIVEDMKELAARFERSRQTEHLIKVNELENEIKVLWQRIGAEGSEYANLRGQAEIVEQGYVEMIEKGQAGAREKELEWQRELWERNWALREQDGGLIRLLLKTKKGNRKVRFGDILGEEEAEENLMQVLWPQGLEEYNESQERDSAEGWELGSLLKWFGMGLGFGIGCGWFTAGKRP